MMSCDTLLVLAARVCWLVFERKFGWTVILPPTFVDDESKKPKKKKKTHEKSEHNTTPETTFEIGEPDTLKMLEEYEPYAEMVSLGDVSIHWIL